MYTVLYVKEVKDLHQQKSCVYMMSVRYVKLQTMRGKCILQNGVHLSTILTYILHITG